VSGDIVTVGADDERSNVAGVEGDQTDNSAGGGSPTYTFVRSGGIWIQQAYLTASHADADDRPNDLCSVGASVSEDTLLVDAIQEDGNATGATGTRPDTCA
jgi:hypothetical protein